MQIIVFILLGFIIIQEFFNRKERQKLIEAIIAKNLGEVSDLEHTRKIKVNKNPEIIEAVPENELSDDEFDKMIDVTNKGK